MVIATNNVRIDFDPLNTILIVRKPDRACTLQFYIELILAGTMMVGKNTLTELA
jgi:hypothetical protein